MSLLGRSRSSGPARCLSALRKRGPRQSLKQARPGSVVLEPVLKMTPLFWRVERDRQKQVAELKMVREAGSGEQFANWPGLINARQARYISASADAA